MRRLADPDEVIERDVYRNHVISSEEMSFLSKPTYQPSYIQFIKKEEWFQAVLQSNPDLKPKKDGNRSNTAQYMDSLIDKSKAVIKALEARFVQTKLNGS